MVTGAPWHHGGGGEGEGDEDGGGSGEDDGDEGDGRIYWLQAARGSRDAGFCRVGEAAADKGDLPA